MNIVTQFDIDNKQLENSFLHALLAPSRTRSTLPIAPPTSHVRS